MLVLTRRIGEEIIVDGDIRVQILSIRGGRVRIGVTAPPACQIDRGELHHRREAMAAEVDAEVLEAVVG